VKWGSSRVRGNLYRSVPKGTAHNKLPLPRHVPLHLECDPLWRRHQEWGWERGMRLGERPKEVVEDW